MDYKIYKTTYPHPKQDTSLPYETGIAELLLTFQDITTKPKIVTTPARNEVGFNVVACQSFFKGFGNAAYIFLPSTEHIYQFLEAKIAMRDPLKRFLKAGVKGLIFGAEETGFIERKFDAQTDERDELEEELSKLFINYYHTDYNTDNWYHFTGTAEIILEELQKKCALTLR